MPADIKPSTYLGAGFAANSGSHTISFNTQSAGSNKLLAQLLDAAADPTTGNVEQILLALCEAFYSAYRTQVAAGNKPLSSSAQKSGNPDSASGGFFMSYTFNFTFTETSATWTIVPES